MCVHVCVCEREREGEEGREGKRMRKRERMDRAALWMCGAMTGESRRDTKCGTCKTVKARFWCWLSGKKT